MFNLKFNADRAQFEGQFKATVSSLGDTVQTNVNGTEYVVGAVKFVNASGIEVERSAVCYMKNVEKGVTVGNEYLCNITVTEDRPKEPIISISSLTSAVRATTDDFNFNFDAALAAEEIGAEELKN
jgi:hypothetical protein